MGRRRPTSKKPRREAGPAGASSLTAPGRNPVCRNLDRRLPAPGTETVNFCRLSHQVVILCYSGPHKLKHSVSFQLKRKEAFISGFFWEGYLATWCFSDSTGLLLLSSPGTSIKLWTNYLSGPSESQCWGREERASRRGLLCSLETAAVVKKSEIQHICRLTGKWDTILIKLSEPNPAQPVHCPCSSVRAALTVTL